MNFMKYKKDLSSFPHGRREVDRFGHTSLRVKDKPFVILGGDKSNPSLSIKTLKTTQEMLIQQLVIKIPLYRPAWLDYFST